MIEKDLDKSAGEPSFVNTDNNASSTQQSALPVAIEDKSPSIGQQNNNSSVNTTSK